MKNSTNDIEEQSTHKRASDTGLDVFVLLKTGLK